MQLPRIAILCAAVATTSAIYCILSDSAHPTSSADAGVHSGTLEITTPAIAKNGTSDRDDPIRSLLTMAAKDAPAAIEQAKSRYAGDELRRSLVYLAQESTFQDWSKLNTFLNALPEKPDQQAVMSLLARRAISRDSKHFIEFAKAESSSSRRAELLKFSVYAFVAEHRFEEAQEIIPSLPPSMARTEALHSIAEGMGHESPESAIAWAAKMEAREEQLEALKTLVLLFRQRKDFDRIGLVAATSRDSAIQAMCERQLRSR